VYAIQILTILYYELEQMLQSVVTSHTHTPPTHSRSAH